MRKTSTVKLSKAIQAYRKQGFFLIALEPGTKKPVMTGYQEKPVAAANHLLKHGGNIGILTGRESRLVVYDFDDPQKGGEFYQALAMADQVTATARTGRAGGGHHFYFQLPEGSGKVSSRNFDGGELKAEGVFVVAPPSIHPDTGKVYRWVEPLSKLKPWGNEVRAIARKFLPDQPEQGEFPFAPGIASKRARCIEEIKNRVLVEGVREKSLWMLFWILRKNGDNKSHAERQIKEVNSRAVDRRGKPAPLPPSEINQIVKARKQYGFACSTIRKEFNISLEQVCNGCPKLNVTGRKMMQRGYQAAKIAESPKLPLALRIYAGVESGSIDPRNKSECARLLGVTRRGVSEAFKSLKAAGYDPEAAE